VEAPGALAGRRKPNEPIGEKQLPGRGLLFGKDTMTDAPYGWYLRHLKTGRLVRLAMDASQEAGVDVVVDVIDVVERTVEATQFPKREHAADMLAWLNSGTEPFPPCDVVDATIPAEPISDTNPVTVKSQDEIVREARERGARERELVAHQVPLLTADEMQAYRVRRAAGRFGSGGFGVTAGQAVAQRQHHQQSGIMGLTYGQTGGEADPSPRPLFSSGRAPPAQPENSTNISPAQSTPAQRTDK